jgi:hypothetical protein
MTEVRGRITEIGMRSRKSDARSQRPEFRGGKPAIRSPELDLRSPDPEDRGQRTEVGSTNPDSSSPASDRRSIELEVGGWKSEGGAGKPDSRLHGFPLRLFAEVRFRKSPSLHPSSHPMATECSQSCCSAAGITSVTRFKTSPSPDISGWPGFVLRPWATRLRGSTTSRSPSSRRAEPRCNQSCPCQSPHHSSLGSCR